MASTAQDPQAPLRGPEKKEEDHEEDLEYSPFYGIEKGAVLQEARLFHNPQIDARRARQIITKLLYLLTQGEAFTKKESSEVFFAATKLFQHKDTELRRMVYLCIKEICPSSDEVIIITSSLIKDISSKNDLYRANAIRVLCKIIDAQLLAQIERYLKQAVVDKAPTVASAALVSGMHLLEQSSDIVKRWNNEVIEAANNKNQMVQCHAIALQHALRASDRLAVSKLVSGLTRGNVKGPLSPMSQCLLIRYVSQVIADSTPDNQGERPFYDFLEKCLRHKSEMVIFEAARAITNLRDFTAREIAPAITVLQLFLSSSKPVLKFSAVRILNKVAMTHPMAVANCNIDMESLISDPNRSIATLAITTLLKTGNEGSVDRLLKQIGNFMSDIADDFKIVVVEAIRSLCLKFPKKHRSLMNFLSNVLREEGGFEYKRAIVDSILILIREIPEAKEAGLSHLCEFIEDCEFTYLSTQILHLLGMEGPKTAEPAKYIRYIYNRVVLENATVRAAAVSSLAKFGAEVEEVRPRVILLLKRALFDNDDEVRDRATLCVEQLTGSAGGPEKLAPRENFPLKNLEKALEQYLQGSTDQPFDLSSVAPEVEEAPPAAAKTPAFGAGAPKTTGLEEYVEMLKVLPQYEDLGPLFKSCPPVQLTEEDTEYNITVVKHFFEAHTVFQFNCTNTIDEQILEDVRIVMDMADAEEFEEEMQISLPVMPLNGVAQAYTILSRPEGSYATGKFANILKFTVKEVDPGTGEAEEQGFEDEYELMDVEVSMSDYIKLESVPNFRAAWEEMDPSTEVGDDYGLGERENLEDTVEAVIGTLGMQTCEGTDVVPPNARSHQVLLAGRFLGDALCLARLSFGIDSSRNVAMKVVARGETGDVSEAVHLIIQEA
ncbi:hypothetical protein BSKO_03672 [Bryopsis sp. KO-2023]|nr:hypothetical protein BSKO_03672 [Bryopsis sp. KO-2023]